jgi:hypothetical protein
MNHLKDYILVLENIVSDELCESILNEYKISEEWREATINQDTTLNKKIRNCKILGISIPEVIDKNNEIRKKLDDQLFECAKKSITKYNEIFKNCIISRDSGYELLKYETGGFYEEHIDSFTSEPRTISCSFILNNDFKGGDFSFFNNTVTYSLKKGSVIMFPSNFLYPHNIMPITEGTRYSIITWFR